MIRNILIALFGFVVIALFILWILNGGIGRAYNSAKNFSFSSGSSTGFALPWQPDGLIPRISSDSLFPDGSSAYEAGSPEAELARLQEDYDNVQRDVNEYMSIGNPSPDFGKVKISNGYPGSRADKPSEEYVTIEAQYSNESPLSISGWSLESALSGVRVSIPSAASPFWLGAVNTLDPVQLAPGHAAMLITGTSPVGVSFRENICTGYLSQFQDFSPSLALRCPTPTDEIPVTVENMQRYGSECIDVAPYIPTCQFPQQLPPSLSPSCRTYLQTTLSYNGCVAKHASDAVFSENTWRLYLGSLRELWRNDHDALRLLDNEGRVVDVFVY